MGILTLEDNITEDFLQSQGFKRGWTGDWLFHIKTHFIYKGDKLLTSSKVKDARITVIYHQDIQKAQIFNRDDYWGNSQQLYEIKDECDLKTVISLANKKAIIRL